MTDEIKLDDIGLVYIPPSSDMTLRDWFAGMALQGICAHQDTLGFSVDGIVKKSYQMADAMIRARGE